MHADLQRLLADDLLSDFGSLTMERLRQLRGELTTAEGDVSLARRMTQGRLDIVGHEVDRRERPDVERTGPQPADPTGLLYDMPDILADVTSSPGPSEPGSSDAGTPPRSPGLGRMNPVAEPGAVAMSLFGRLDQIAPSSVLSGLADLARDQLGDLFEGLRAFEVELSTTRRTLHDRIDTIQNEIARRYRDGEASVDALLS